MKEKKNHSLWSSSKQIRDITIADLSERQILIFAYETAKTIGWNIDFINKTGFIAYAKTSMRSWGEEIRISIEANNLNISSKCIGTQLFDGGKNRKNLDEFEEEFEKTRQKLSEIEIEEKYNEISKRIAENKNTDYDPLSKKEKTSGFLSFFIPRRGFFITPLLVYINIFVFILMVISGVDFFMPSGESLLLWGANFRPMTINGEWWRLITSVFIHIGIFHLLMNMYALLYIGLLLEPYLGKARFLSAYLLSGLVASVASIYWNELIISAGASGAIFGMYGVFLALLLTNMIEKSARKPLLTSIGIFVAYNLINGLKGDIDNAAHIGGLLSGILIGFSFYPGLLKPDIKKKYLTIGLLAVVLTTLSFTVAVNISSDITKYDEEMNTFAQLEESALHIFKLPQDASIGQITMEIDNGLANWYKCIEIIKNADKYDLPEVIHKRNKKLLEYCDLRIKSFTAIKKAVIEQNDLYNKEIEKYNEEINQIIQELSNQN